MPKFKTKEDKLIYDQQLLKGQVKVFSGRIDNENILEDNEFEIIKKCQKAYFTDALTKTTIDLLLSPILQANYEIVIDEKDPLQVKAKELCEFTLNNLFDSFQTFKNHLTLSLILGCQYFEIVWNVEKYKDIIYNRILRLLPIKIENIKSFLFDDKGDFTGLEITDHEYNSKTLYKEDLFYIIHNPLFNDPRGNSEIRAILPLIEIKDKLLRNSEKTIARGVGVPIAYADTALMTEESFNKYATLMKNIANTNGAYAIVDKNEIERIEFLKVDHSDTLPLLEFINRDIFFNTLTQFLTTGIGQNGSRAAAEELKSPYMLKVSSIVKEFEGYLQWLINIIVSNSSLSLHLDKSKYPLFKFVNIMELDMVAFSNILTNFSNLGLKLNDQDINYIRQLLRLPNIEENKETGLSVKKTLDYNLRQTKIEDFNWDEAAVSRLYTEFEDKADKAFEELVEEIAARIYANKPIDLNEIETKFKQKQELLIDEVRRKSFEVVKNELKKFNFKKKFKLGTYKLNFLTDFLFKLIDIIKSTVLSLTKENKEFTSIKREIIDKTKSERRQFINSVLTQIQNVRGEVFKKLSPKKAGNTRFKYVSRLDGNTCDSCRALNGTIFSSVDEIKEAGLNLDGPINPNCLGHLGNNVCRCQFIPV